LRGSSDLGTSATDKGTKMISQKAQAQKTIRELLEKEYFRLKAKNGQYSMRSFARKLNIGPSSLSLILNGKRGVGQKLAINLLAMMDLDLKTREKLLSAWWSKSKNKTLYRPGAQSFLELKADQYQTISDPLHFALLALTKRDDFKNDPEWMAQQLGATGADCKRALKRLIRLQFLKEQKGKLQATYEQIYSPDQVPLQATRAAQLKCLDQARDSLQYDSIEIRDFVSEIFTLNPRDLPEIKKQLRLFLDQILEKYENPIKAEVYQLSIQLIPFKQKRGDHL